MRSCAQIVTLMSIALGFLLAGCDSKTTVADSNTTVPESNTSSAVTLVAKFVPSTPKVGNCLQVRLVQSRGRVSYAWTFDGNPLDNETNQLCDGRLKKDSVVQVEVKDDSGSQVLQAVFANTPPRIVRIRQDPPKLIAGMPLTVIPEGHDPDRDDLSYEYRWFINGNEIYDVTEQTLPGNLFSGGDTITVTVTPFDGQDQGPSLESGSLTIPNAVPRFLSSSPDTFQGSQFVYNVLAEDPDGGLLTYALAKAPPGMKIDADTGELIWTVPSGWNEFVEVEVEAKDSVGAVTVQRFSLDISRE